ncbi:L-threonylcarbamoyladenylate synthase [Xanthocytophaga agilis]|uniref:L-threonylcarbamoyladenylate synthase n=1 Tax=Xanthocytophaga agilis TaxID=3048010 RepID=A0AAE3QYK7_9BACT|nr:L-threonylcarbamoyladenylate synthase [Xanthocytophaga agilis]MDJ1500406.1 L-threonylcarbamoyladenylate synthase [Xanthocytophaga agilis]
MTDSIQRAYEILKTGGVVLSPTDTVWSILCDARNDAAVKRVHELKKRETPKPLVAMISQIGWLPEYMNKVPDIAWDLVEFSERPLTVVYSNGKNVSSDVLASDRSIAIRLVKDNDFLVKLIGKFNRAIVSTSANRPNQFIPRTLDDVDPEIVKGVDYVVPMDQSTKNDYQLANILRLEVNGEIKFIRK